jgi:hypothetical protein
MNIEAKKGGFGLCTKWFWRIVGECPDHIREGHWSNTGYATKKAAIAAAKEAAK